MTKKKLRPIHPFPARMAPSIAWKELKTDQCLRVLDPMAGSGTTLMVARANGHHAVGFDTDPLAVLLAQTWCDSVDPVGVRRAAARVASQAKATWRSIPQRDAYPDGADEEDRKFIRYWFDPVNRRQLKALSTSIRRMRRPDLKRALSCAFSRLIVTKSTGASRARDVPHSRPHRAYEQAPLRALDGFGKAVEHILANAPFDATTESPTASVQLGDARELPLEDETVDLVITSPPYLNAIDYLRAHRFTLIWLGYSLEELREVRATNIGTEVGGFKEPETDGLEAALKSMGPLHRLPQRWQRVVARFVGDMDGVLGEVGRVLKKDGRALFIVGDCTMRGVYVRNSSALARLGERHGLMLKKRRSRPLPENRRYLPPPKKKAGTTLDNRMRHEIILELVKQR